jgi:hypothetical protein
MPEQIDRVAPSRLSNSDDMGGRRDLDVRIERQRVVDPRGWSPTTGTSGPRAIASWKKPVTLAPAFRRMPHLS